MELLVHGVEVTVIGLPDMTEDEIRRYIGYVRKRLAGEERLSMLTIADAGCGQVELGYEMKGPKFERIRRITGYLVGTIDRWNNAKRSEEQERVKHV